MLLSGQAVVLDGRIDRVWRSLWVSWVGSHERRSRDPCFLGGTSLILSVDGVCVRGGRCGRLGLMSGKKEKQRYK